MKTIIYQLPTYKQITNKFIFYFLLQKSADNILIIFKVQPQLFMDTMMDLFYFQ